MSDPHSSESDMATHKNGSGVIASRKGLSQLSLSTLGSGGELGMGMHIHTGSPDMTKLLSPNTVSPRSLDRIADVANVDMEMKAATNLPVLNGAIPAPSMSGVSQLDRDHAYPVFNAVVKVFCVSTTPSFSMPWQKQRQTQSTCSGFVISGRRIITNAHGVKYHSHVRVRKNGDSKKYSAKVLQIGHDCDLALLTVTDEEFWDNVVALEFGGIPSLQDAVICVGYPTGGDNISVTKGVVSRVDVSEYSHAGEYLLAIQIDAAINAGNSGGPALMEDKVVGVAFETLENAENIGFIIPIVIVQHFLSDIERNGAYTGFCTLGFSWQCVENSHLRKYLNMSRDQHGILVNKLQPLHHSATVLQPFDVLTAINDIPIADDGTIHFRQNQRIAFRHIASMAFRGEECKLSILRNGEVKEVMVKVELPRPLVPVHLYDKQPSYFVYAGCVFTILSRPFLYHEYGKHWARKAPIRLCEQAFYGCQTDPNEQLVILNQFLVDEINIGYQNLTNTQVLAVNGTKVKNLRHLVDLIEKTTEGFIRVDLDREKVVLLDREAALVANGRILCDNNIPFAKSLDLSDQHEKISV